MSNTRQRRAQNKELRTFRLRVQTAAAQAKRALENKEGLRYTEAEGHWIEELRQTVKDVHTKVLGKPGVHGQSSFNRYEIVRKAILKALGIGSDVSCDVKKASTKAARERIAASGLVPPATSHIENGIKPKPSHPLGLTSFVRFLFGAMVTADIAPDQATPIAKRYATAWLMSAIVTLKAAFSPLVQAFPGFRFVLIVPVAVGQQSSCTSKRDAVAREVLEMIYELNEEDAAQILSHLGTSSGRAAAVQEPETLTETDVPHMGGGYQLIRLQVWSGGAMAIARVTLQRSNDEPVTQAAIGTGPVEAICRAVEVITGETIQLNGEEFVVQGAAGGAEAIGMVSLSIKSGQQTFRGRSNNRNILAATMDALLCAVNHKERREPAS